MYAHWVAAGRNVLLWEGALNRQVFLGDGHFVERMQALMTSNSRVSQAIPLRQRGAPKALADWLRECGSREEALWMAHARSGLSMTALAAELGLSVARVSQLIAKAQANGGAELEARSGRSGGVLQRPVDDHV